MIRKIQRLISDKYYRFGILQSKGFFKRMDDRKYLEMMYQFKLGKPLNLDNPRSFNEKLQWLKLHDHNPIYTQMVDKYEAKKFVASIIGEEYIIPTLGVWNHYEDIDFSELPNQFVLKCTHDSGGLVIVRDKSAFDAKKAKKIINKSLRRNFYYYGREWPYKNVKPRIIAEKYMEDEKSQDLPDYKIHVFEGVPKVILVCRDRFTEHGLTEDFFTDNWTHLDVRRPNHDNSDARIETPSDLEEMLDLAKKLSEKIPFLRTDFYTINGKVYFGELTFYPASGFDSFDPSSFDDIMGDWIKIDVMGGVILHKNNKYILLNFAEEKTQVIGLTDYKFFCFNGQAEFLYISKGLEDHSTAEISFYDLTGRELPFHRNDYRPYHNAVMPENLNDMVSIANILAGEIPSAFVRIDLYSINRKIYFSEITFSPCSGMVPFEPMSADDVLGQRIDIAWKGSYCK